MSDSLALPSVQKRKHSFMFTDYSPKEFARIREISGITSESYLESFKETTMPSFSEGRSGAFLYFTLDRKYIVKGMTESEFNKLLTILTPYVAYFVSEIERGNQPLITKFLGAHRIIMYDIPLYFVIMKNVCPTVSERYDLKGSWIGRHSSKHTEYNPRTLRPKKFSANGKELGDVGKVPAVAASDGRRHLAHHVHHNRLMDRHVCMSACTGSSAKLFLDSDLQNCFLLNPVIGKRMADQVLRDIKFLKGKLATGTHPSH